MARRQAVGFVQLGMDVGGHVAVLGSGRGRLHVRNQARRVFIAGFTQMRFVPRPRRLAFDTVAGFGIMGRVDCLSGRRHVLLVRAR